MGRTCGYNDGSQAYLNFFLTNTTTTGMNSRKYRSTLEDKIKMDLKEIEY